MSRMNALIPLQGQTPDIVGSLDRGFSAGRRAGLANLYRENGAGIASGDQNALAALAQYDPRAALDVQGAQQGMQAQRELMGQRRAASGREQIKFESAQHAQNVARQMDRAYGLMLNAQSQEEWDQAARMHDPTLVGQFGNKSALMRSVIRARDGAMAAIKFDLEQGQPDWKVVNGQAIDGNDPLSGAKDIPGFRADAGAKSAAEQKINRIIETHGVDRRTAVGIVDGVLNVSRHPADGSVLITDLSNNEVTTPAQAGQQLPPLPEAERGNSFEGTNPSGALGVRGIAASAANTILDSVGLGQIAPNVDQAQTAMDSLATRTVQGLSAQWPGRPSNLTREMIDGMTVRPGDFRTGPNRAANKVSDMKREIERAIASAHRVATSQGKYSTTQKTEAQAALNDLLPLYQDYQDLEDGLSSSTGGDGTTAGQTSNGVSWSISE